MNSVLHGDCLELMKSIPDGSVDMILCDLPYGTTACKWDVIIPFERLWEQYKRVIKKNGAIVLTASQPFTSALVMSNPKMFRYEWIWEKEQGTNFPNANKMPLKNHENICIFYNSLPNYNPQFFYAEPYFRKGGERNQTVQILGSTPCGTKSKDRGFADGRRFPITILKHKRDSSKYHPTQKPVSLFEYLIKTYTNEGETVLDNCAGSGTTAIACINTNRNYILMEKEQKYFDLIRDRIEKHQPQLKIAI